MLCLSVNVFIHPGHSYQLLHQFMRVRLVWAPLHMPITKSSCFHFHCPDILYCLLFTCKGTNLCLVAHKKKEQVHKRTFRLSRTEGPKSRTQSEVCKKVQRFISHEGIWSRGSKTRVQRFQSGLSGF